MTESQAIFNFLTAAGWNAAHHHPLCADFSTRRFTRLAHPDGRTAIFMQAAADQKTPQFVAVANLLRQADLSAPEIYAAAPASGLVLMEDFGDTTFGTLLDQGHENLPLYSRAAEALAHIHKTFRPADALALPHFSTALFTEQVELFLDHYRPPAPDTERAAFREAWHTTLAPLESLPQTLLLRDFMPDNVMDLPNRKGWRNVGLLDFQDSGLGPLAYDLASLCESVRREGGIETLDAVLTHYLKHNPVMPLPDLRRACRILAAQRHMRILGLLAKRNDKPLYEARVRATITHLAQDEALRHVRPWMELT